MFRTKSGEELEKCMDSRNIQEYPKGTLFEVSAVEKKTGEHGEYGVACVSTVVGGKRRDRQDSTISERYGRVSSRTTVFAFVLRNATRTFG